eukprot:TRINITY_DN15583_c0_g1_i2.p1 TRINITY_DN15583_c0_g1~~TRINITY_DN15583_c0_g1_i2.p1  ORF type:complete len:231 (-),score=59.82 TRINITY_DN15583_c0_g1_i2:38-709(-)
MSFFDTFLCCAGFRDHNEKPAKTSSLDPARVRFQRRLQNCVFELNNAVDIEVTCLFEGADLDDNSELDLTEIETVMKRLKGNGFDVDVDISNFDKDHSGSVDKNEFESAMCAELCKKPDNMFKIFKDCSAVQDLENEAFRAADLNEDGLVSAEELVDVLGQLHEMLDQEKPTMEQVRQELQLHDKDGNEMLGEDETQTGYLCKIYYMPQSTALREERRSDKAK